MSTLKENFLLDPDVIFLNHGSFGATPKPVFAEYQRWQRELESQPVRFLGRDFNRLLRNAREALSDFLNVAADDLVFIPNATHGANIVAHSLKLEPGDEVLTTDHEYGACDYAWQVACQKTGADYVRRPISLPVQDEDEIVEQFWQGFTPGTKVIYLSHITSPTALHLPVEKICQRAKDTGILSIVDAAHSPGQIHLDLQSLGADIVFGNCHKWMLSPKGAGFLYVHRDAQPLIKPLIVSWGYHAADDFTTGSQFVDYLQWTGTSDPAAYLAVPAAIRFMQENDWDAVRKNSHALLRDALYEISNLTGIESPYPLDSDFYAQMGIASLPPCDLVQLKKRLYDEFHVEVPLIQWQDRQFIRVSIQGYNTHPDVAALLDALRKLL